MINMLRCTKFKYLLVLFICLFVISYGKKGIGEGEQDWGYITVRKNAHMFWWLYYTVDDVHGNYHEKPLIIWLQGGPGLSSTGYGNFVELGPLDMDLKRRNHTWVKNYNVLFIDNPVGSGFSYVEHNMYCKTNAEIAADLLTFIKQFYNMFPTFNNTPTYIITESYGGKMAVEFANVWYKEQKIGSVKSNFKGVALGSPWISAIDSILEYGPSLLYMGMIDNCGCEKIKELSFLAKKAVDDRKWMEATNQLDNIEATIFNETNNMNLYNALFKSKLSIANNERYSIYGDFADSIDKLAYFMNTVIKQKLMLDHFWGETAAVVSKMLKEDFMKPAIEQVEMLLNETDIKVYIFNGQFDLAVNTVGTLRWLNKLQWNNTDRWKHAKREPLIIDGQIEGYVKQYDKLKMFWINRAGHMAVIDNPSAVNAVLMDLISNS